MPCPAILTVRARRCLGLIRCTACLANVQAVSSMSACNGVVGCNVECVLRVYANSFSHACGLSDPLFILMDPCVYCVLSHGTFPVAPLSFGAANWRRATVSVHSAVAREMRRARPSPFVPSGPLRTARPSVSAALVRTARPSQVSIHGERGEGCSLFRSWTSDAR